MYKKRSEKFKDFLGECEQIPRKLSICLHFPRKSLRENFIFLAALSESSDGCVKPLGYN